MLEQLATFVAGRFDDIELRAKVLEGVRQFVAALEGANTGDELIELTKG